MAISTYRLEIDPTAAEAGAIRVVKSFDSIKQAADRLRGSVTNSFTAATKAIKELSNLSGVNSKAVSDIKAISNVLASFKGPTGPSVENTKKFIQVLKGLSGFKAPSSAGLASFLGALSSFKGPSAASATNTSSLIRALGKLSVARVPSSFIGFLGSLSSFRGPSMNAGKNTVSFLNAIANFRAPRGIGAAMRSFEKLAATIEKAANSMGRLRAQNGRLNGPGGFGGGAGSGGPRRMAGEYDLLRNSILRTQTVMNAFGGILGIKAIANASNAIIKIRAQLEAATGSVAQGRIQFGFVTEQANKLGLEFTSVAKSYGQLLGSVKGTNVTFKETQDLFRGFATGARALQLSTDDVDGVFRALGQILSKGKLQAEELRGQLGDRLPGAFVRFAVALKMTKPGELDQALKRGAISGDLLKNALLDVAKTMENEFSASAEKASKTVDSAFNRLKNVFTFKAADFGTNGFNEALINLADGLTKLLKSETLNTGLKVLAAGLKLISNNMNGIGAILSGALITLTLRWATNLLLVAKASQGAAAAMSAWGLISAASGVAKVTASFAALNMVMKANVFLIIGSAIAGFIYWLSTLQTEAQKANKSLKEFGQDNADLENFVDAYIERILDLTGAHKDLNAEMIKTINIAANTRRESAEGGTPSIKSRGARYEPSQPGFLRDFGVNYLNLPIQAGIGKQEESLVKRLGIGKFDATKGFQLNPVKTEQDYKKLAEAAAEIGATIKILDQSKAEVSAGFRDLYAVISGREKDLSNPLVVGSFKNAADIKKSMVKGEYNGTDQPPGLDGGTPEESTAKAETKARMYENIVQRAVDSFNDLKTAAVGAQSIVQAALDGATDLIGAKARAAAVGKVQDIEQSFRNGQDGGSGLISVAKALGLVATSADTAKNSLVKYYTEQETLLESSKRAGELGADIIGLKNENKIREDNLEAIMRGGSALEESNIQREIETRLLGITTDNVDELRKSLEDQLRTRQELNRAEEFAQDMARARLQSNINVATGGLYSSGLLPQDLENAKQMIILRETMKNGGYGEAMIDEATKVREAADIQNAALQRMSDQYEAVRQMSVDTADVLVGAFRGFFKSGEDAGKSFADRMRDLFSDLKDIVLDFFLFNPIRNWLTDSLTGGSTRYVTEKGPQAIDFGSAADILASIGGSSRNYTPIPGSNSKGFSSNGITSVGSGFSANQTQSIRETAKIIGDEVGGVVVTANRDRDYDYGNQRQQRPDPLAAIKQLYNSDDNLKTLKSGFKDIGDVFKGTATNPDGTSVKGIGQSISAIGKGLGKVASVAGTAFAAFSIGSSAAKALGLGQGGQKILGGASAGFTIGGPVGAAIGAAIGGIAALFSKAPSASANVVVGEGGTATVGTSRKRGKGDLAGAQAAAGSGAESFNSLAAGIDAFLKPGNYGAFGTYGFKGKGKENDNFYSLTGSLNRKGKPLGRRGVDFMNGTPDEVSLFAIRSQLKSDNFVGADPIYKQIANNSRATTTAAFTADVTTGQNYLAFVESARIQNELVKTVRDLNKSYESLTRQAKELRLNENLLLVARDKQLNRYKTDFNEIISQQILGFTDPLQGVYNDLLKEYRDTVSSAVAVGGDLTAVEQLYGLKRTQVLEDFLNRSTNSIKNNAQALLTQLNSSQNSPLSPTTVFTNSQAQFRGLASELSAGNFGNAGNLQTYTDNYLESARTNYRSSADYFAVFDEVTALLRGVSDQSGTLGGTNAGNLPELPGIQVIVDELAKQNDDLVEAQKNLGSSMLDSNGQIIYNLESMNAMMAQMLAAAGGLSSGFDFGQYSGFNYSVNV